jgi:hypothetical protein
MDELEEVWSGLVTFTTSHGLLSVAGPGSGDRRGLRGPGFAVPQGQHFRCRQHRLMGTGIVDRPLVSILLVALVAALVVGSRWLLSHQLPPADYRPRFAADPIPENVAERSAQIATELPKLRLTDVRLIALSTRLARRGRTPETFGREFVVLAVANTGLILLYALLLPTGNGSINVWHALFFSLLSTLYDRYRPINLARFDKEDVPGNLSPCTPTCIRCSDE